MKPGKCKFVASTCGKILTLYDSFGIRPSNFVSLATNDAGINALVGGDTDKE